MKAALQLALSYFIGFGVMKDNKKATALLNRYSLEYADCRSYLEWIRNRSRPFLSYNVLFSRLAQEGYIDYIDFPHYYREKQLLERAETNFREEIQSVQLVFGKNHWLYVTLASELASLMESQGRWEEAEELEVQMLKMIKSVLGTKHRETLISMHNLALTYRDQKRWKEAKELETQVLKIRRRVLGNEHPETLSSTANLAEIYRTQG